MVAEQNAVRGVVEAYPELWHYTTALGLNGILGSQQLWATDIGYLNDAEEFVGFFERRLAQIARDGVSDWIKRVRGSPAGAKLIAVNGGEEKVLEHVPIRWAQGMRDISLKLRVYVTSFCRPSPGNESHDGLLSQWRGYGTDGGYAIVFETRKLNELLEDEAKRFFYAQLRWGDVDYYEGEVGTAEPHAEAIRWEETIRKTIAETLFDKNAKPAASLFEPIVALATRHKHCGFREESEVRISLVAAGEKDVEKALAEGSKMTRKQVRLMPRAGLLVPHIALFERRDGEQPISLPVSKIIVGPHPDKLKRKKSVEVLLRQLGMDAKVEVSSIPYLGR